MSEGVLRGRLSEPFAGPREGELCTTLLEFGNVVIEQIQSGTLLEPGDYEQEQDEWVVLLTGGATLVIDGAELVLAPGDWLFLPSGCHHQVTRTEPGTEWLAVHIHPRPRAEVALPDPGS